MDYAALVGRVWEDGPQALPEPGHAVRAHVQHVLHPAGPELVEHLHPAVGALRVVHPQAQDVLAAAQFVGQHRVDGRVAGAPPVAHGHVEAVDEHEGVDRLERPRPPAPEVLPHAVRYRRDRLGAHREAVDLPDGPGDVALRHPARVHGYHAGLDVGEVGAALGHRDRLNDPSRSLGTDISSSPAEVLTVLGVYPLRPLAVALGDLSLLAQPRWASSSALSIASIAGPSICLRASWASSAVSAPNSSRIALAISSLLTLRPLLVMSGSAPRGMTPGRGAYTDNLTNPFYAAGQKSNG